MWLMLPDSFTSTVAARHLDRPGQPVDTQRLVVRARLRAHLDVLLVRHVGLLPGVEVFDSTGTDYRWRMVLPRDVWAEVVRRETASTSYINFKDEAGRLNGNGSIFVRALHNTWGTLRGLQ